MTAFVVVVVLADVGAAELVVGNTVDGVIEAEVAATVVDVLGATLVVVG